MNPRFIKSAAAKGDLPADKGLEVAVVGRSNSGKSSAINRIVGAKKLARVSKTPGRTQLINFFELAPERRLVDLPGYGFAQVPKATQARWQTLIEAYFGDRESLAGLIITIDIRRGFRDLDFAAMEWGAMLDVPLLLLLAKADKLSRGAGLKQLQAMTAQAPPGTALELFSATSGQGVTVARQQLLSWLEFA